MSDAALAPGDIPDFVKEAEAAMANGEQIIEERKEVTIKFAKGLVGEPFLSKNGKELVEVKIPNADQNDKTPWASFVISPKMIHDNKFSKTGKGVWMSASEPFDGTRDQGDAMKMFCNLRRLSTRKVCFVVVSRRKRIDSVVF